LGDQLTAALNKSAQLYGALRKALLEIESSFDLAAFAQYADWWFLPPYSNLFRLFMFFGCLVFVVGVFARSSVGVSQEPDLFVSILGSPNMFTQQEFA